MSRPLGTATPVALRQSYAFALVLLVVTVAINYYLQPNFFQPGLLSMNLLLFVPLIRGRRADGRRDRGGIDLFWARSSRWPT